MKILYLECGMGAAGDMLMAALSELLPDRQLFLDKMNSIGIPGVKVEAEKVSKCGIGGTHMKVSVYGEEETQGSSDHHDHHDHHHAHPGDIYSIIEGLDLPEKVKADAKAVYALIAKAESEVHEEPARYERYLYRQTVLRNCRT